MEAIKRINIISRNGFKNPDDISGEDIHFLESALNSGSEEIRPKIYWAVGQIGIHQPDKVEKFIDKAFCDLQSGNPQIKENALFAIGRTGRANVSLVEKRIENVLDLSKDGNPKVRMAMIWACENIATVKPGIFKNHIHIFENMLDDNDDKYVKKEIPEIFRVIGKRNPEMVEKSLPKLKAKLADENEVMKIHVSGAIKVIEKNLEKRKQTIV